MRRQQRDPDAIRAVCQLWHFDMSQQRRRANLAEATGRLSEAPLESHWCNLLERATRPRVVVRWRVTA